MNLTSFRLSKIFVVFTSGASKIVIHHTGNTWQTNQFAESNLLPWNGNWRTPVFQQHAPIQSIVKKKNKWIAHCSKQCSIHFWPEIAPKGFILSDKSNPFIVYSLRSFIHVFELSLIFQMSSSEHGDVDKIRQMKIFHTVDDSCTYVLLKRHSKTYWKIYWKRIKNVLYFMVEFERKRLFVLES